MKLFQDCIIIVAALASFLLVADLKANEVLLFSTNGLELWAVPSLTCIVNDTDPVMSAKLVLRTYEPQATMVTFTDFAIRGDVMQTWQAGPLGTPTPVIRDVTSEQGFDERWAPLDSHLLFGAETIGGGVGASFDGITETNDGTLTDRFYNRSLAGAFAPMIGFGDLAMVAPTDAFFLSSEYRTNELEFASVVTSRVENDGIIRNPIVSLSLTVLGSQLQGADHCSEFNSFLCPPAFDFRFSMAHDDHGQVSVFLVPEPQIAWPLIGLCMLLRRGLRSHSWNTAIRVQNALPRTI